MNQMQANFDGMPESSPIEGESAPEAGRRCLELVSSTPLNTVFGTDANVFVTGLSADPSARTLFLSFYSVSAPFRAGIRALPLDGLKSSSDTTSALQLSDAYFCPAGRANGVCFVRATGTLLACTFEEFDGRRGHWLVALSQPIGGERWTAEHRVELEPISGDVRFAELDDRRVLFSESYSTRLHVLHISNPHRLQEMDSVQVDQQFSTFDARTIESETFVALISKDGSHVCLSRLVADYSLQELCSIPLSDAWKVLWFGERLLVAHFDSLIQCDSVLEVWNSNDSLTPGPALLNERNIIKWCEADARIAILDYVLQELFIYEHDII